MKVNEILSSFEIFTTIEERKVLSKLTSPVLLKSLPERDQVVVENLIRKSLVIKIGMENPKVIVNSENYDN